MELQLTHGVWLRPLAPLPMSTKLVGNEHLPPSKPQAMYDCRLDGAEIAADRLGLGGLNNFDLGHRVFVFNRLT